MTDIYHFRGQTLIVRAAMLGRDGGPEIVTRLTRNGGERRSAYRPDVVRALGQRISNDAPPPPPAMRHRDNGAALVR